jgi:MFS family permease
MGLIMAGTVTTGWMCVLAIFIFSIGEMACSPKFSEYIGLMAPPEKKALYMGYSNIPFAVGWAGANFIGGPLYDHLSDKFALARDYLITQVGLGASAVEAMTKTEAMAALTEALGQSEAAVQRLLWDHYHPQSFWFVCMGIGLVSTFAMLMYHFWLLGDAKKRAAAGGAQA